MIILLGTFLGILNVFCAVRVFCLVVQIIIITYIHVFTLFCTNAFVETVDAYTVINIKFLSHFKAH